MRLDFHLSVSTSVTINTKMLSSTSSSVSTSARPSKRMFNTEEDKQLKELVEQFGKDSWELVARHMIGRNARQCKERYLYYLDTNINNDPFGIEEDVKLLNAVDKNGTKWSAITILFDRRTQYALKNRYQYLQRCLKKMGDKGTIKKVHELPPPKKKPQPKAPSRILKKQFTSDSPVSESSYDNSSQTPSLKNTPITTPDVNPIQKQEEPTPLEVDNDIDAYMSPQTEIYDPDNEIFDPENDYDIDRFF